MVSNIRLQAKAEDWKEALYLGVEILEEEGYVEAKYYKAILKYFEDYGPYMVIAPHVVLAHARPSDGVKKVGISFVTLKEGIKFGCSENDPVKLIITLAAVDGESHINILEQLSELLLHTKEIEKICAAKGKEEVECILGQYLEEVYIK